MATTLYVSSNGSDVAILPAGLGTEASPYTTLKQALNAAELQAESGAATSFVVEVGPGTYNCSIDMEDYPNLNSTDITVTFNGTRKGEAFVISPGSVDPSTDAILNMGYWHIYATNLTVDGFVITSPLADHMAKPMFILSRVPSAAQAGNVAYTAGTDNTVAIKNSFFTIQANEPVLADARITNPFRTHTGGGDATINGGWAITEIKVKDEGQTFVDGNGFKAFTQSTLFPPENQMQVGVTAAVAVISYNTATAATFDPTKAYTTIIQSNVFMTFGVRFSGRPVSISVYRNFFLHVLGPAVNLQQAVDVEVVNCHFSFVGMAAILYKEYADNTDALTKIGYNRFQNISSTDFDADNALKDAVASYLRTQLADPDAVVGSAIMVNGYGGLKDTAMSNMEFMGVQGAGLYVAHDNGGYVSFATVIDRFDSSSDTFADLATETGVAADDLLSLPGTKRTLTNTLANNWAGGYGAGNNTNYNADNDTFWTFAQTNDGNSYYSACYMTNFVRLYHNFTNADVNNPGAVVNLEGSLVSNVVDIRQLDTNGAKYEIGFNLGDGAGGNNQVFPKTATNAAGDKYVVRDQTRVICCGFENFNGSIRPFVRMRNNPVTNRSEAVYGEALSVINGGIAFHLEIDGDRASMGWINPVYDNAGSLTVSVPGLAHASAHTYITGNQLSVDIDTTGISRPVAYFHLSGSQALVQGGFFAAFADPAPNPRDDDILRPRPFYMVTTDVTDGRFWGYSGASAGLGGGVADTLKYTGALGVLRGARINYGGVGKVATALNGWDFTVANNPATANADLVVYDSAYGLSNRANSYDNPFETVSNPNNAIVFGEYRDYSIALLFTDEESGNAAAATTVSQFLKHAAGAGQAYPPALEFLGEDDYGDATTNYAIQFAGAGAAQAGNAPTASRTTVSLGTLTYFSTQDTMALSLNELSPSAVLSLSKVVFGIHPQQKTAVYGDMIGVQTETQNSPKVAVSNYYLAYEFPEAQVSSGNVTLSNKLSDASTIRLRSDIVIPSTSFGTAGLLASGVLKPDNNVLLADMDLVKLSTEQAEAFLGKVYSNLPGYGTLDSPDWGSSGPVLDSQKNPTPEIQLRIMSDGQVLPVAVTGYERVQDASDLSYLPITQDGTDATVTISNIPATEGIWRVYDKDGKAVDSSVVTLTEKTINDSPGLELKIHSFPSTPGAVSYYVAAVESAQLSDWSTGDLIHARAGVIGDFFIYQSNGKLIVGPASVNPYQ